MGIADWIARRHTTAEWIKGAPDQYYCQGLGDQYAASELFCPRTEFITRHSVIASLMAVGGKRRLAPKE